MNAEQFLNEFVGKRLPNNQSLDDFYAAADERKEQLQQLANDIVERQAQAATPADHTRTQSYEALAKERETIVANMEHAETRTEREARERRLDDLQHEMEMAQASGSDADKQMGEKLSELEKITNSVIRKLS